jgi:hypothetical protein
VDHYVDSFPDIKEDDILTFDITEHAIHARKRKATLQAISKFFDKQDQDD